MTTGRELRARIAHELSSDESFRDLKYVGWMLSHDMRLIRPGDVGYATSGRVAQVSSLTANVGWVQIRLPDQTTAWIQAGDVDFSPRKLSIEESIALGRRFLGLTYTWGGRSSFGYDCSGFTQMLVRSRGIIMPRDADLQAAWSGAVPLDREKLRAGDLLFFGSEPDHITHTGMFIGHARFIHDTTYGHPGVQISRLNDQPWTHLLVACRRIK